MNKFIFSISICFVGFIIPFFTRSSDETLNSTLSTSFTILSTLVTIITLGVAIILFDRFGVNAKFKEKQLDTVLALVTELKLLSMTVSNGKLTYVNYVRKCINLDSLPKNTYNVDKAKTLLVPDNFCELLKPISILFENPRLPLEIKNKMNFLNIIATDDINDFDDFKYVKLDINRMGVEPWVVTLPKFTFEMFSINLSILLTSTLNWIEQHSNIKVDFNLIEEKH